ncbi:MAG: hypothetical protein G01um101431_699 [Parcubacteria group bacterium Gr01-1014_31]|nr:MAG: hypothetical protein G01um101431_699 [Parcubacteria group bacterium Gr01-1014_31]
MENQPMHSNSCSCPHHKVVPLAVALIGALFFLQNIGVLGSGIVNVLWPLALLAAGLTKAFGSSCKCCVK